MNEFTMIRIKRTTHKKLTDLGHKGQSYDDVINDLIEGKSKKEYFKFKD